jgi:hypothetical protein
MMQKDFFDSIDPLQTSCRWERLFSASGIYATGSVAACAFMSTQSDHFHHGVGRCAGRKEADIFSGFMTKFTNEEW